MDIKRSKGVTFWGWMFIASAIMSLLQQINPKQQIQLYGISFFIYAVAMCLAFLICGIFILKLKEAARKTAILLCVISIMSIPVYVNKIIKFAKPDGGNEEAAFSVIIIAVVALSLIFELIPIYFFTRASVKEQFKQAQSA